MTETNILPLSHFDTKEKTAVKRTIDVTIEYSDGTKDNAVSEETSDGGSADCCGGNPPCNPLIEICE